MEAIARLFDGSLVQGWVLSHYWLWPVLEILHFIGLCILFGGVIVSDARLAGFVRSVDIAVIPKLVPWMFGGFAINLATGVLFFIGDPTRYASNWGFRVKMVLVVIAGVNAAWFRLRLAGPMHGWHAHGDTTVEAKLVAWVSLLTWTGVLLLGRLIPYVGTG